MTLRCLEGISVCASQRTTGAATVSMAPIMARSTAGTVSKHSTRNLKTSVSSADRSSTT